MAGKNDITLIVITAPSGSIISINHNENVKDKGQPIKQHLDSAIMEGNYELKFVTSFVDYGGESRIQYTLIKRSKLKGSESS